MSKECQKRSLSLPPRSDPSYHREYYQQVRKHKLKVKKASGLQRRAKRKATSIMRKAYRQRTNKFLQRGFDDCVAARTTSSLQLKLDGSFFTWTQTLNPSRNRQGATTLSTERPKKVLKSSSFHLLLNSRYCGRTTNAKDHRDNFIKWATAAQSSIPGAGWGLKADRRFEVGQIIGVYMGERSPTVASCKKIEHSERPHLMAAVADGRGGIDSDHPILLGMHLINDPFFDNDCPPQKVNVQVHTDGTVVAIHRIQPGEEFFMSYN